MESRFERYSPQSDVTMGDGVPGTEYLYLFLLFPGISVFLGIGLYHVSLVLFLLAIGLLVLRSESLGVSRSVLVVLLVFGLFLLYAGLSMWWSSSSAYALFKFSRLAVVCSLLVLAPVLAFPEKDRVYSFLKLSLYMSLLVAALVVYGYFSPDYARPYEIYGSASHIRPGRAIGFGIVVATHYVLAARRSADRYAYGLVLGVLLFGIVISESRGPFVAAIGASGILILLDLSLTRGETYRAYLFVLLSALGLVALVVLHVVFGIAIPTFDRIVPLLQGNLDPSTTGRLQLYYGGVVHWLESPVFGNGLGSFAPWFYGEDAMGYPHNFVIEILAELGLIGLLLFGAVLCVASRSLVANLRTHPVAILLFGLLVFALLNASLSKDLQGNRILFGVIGLATSVELFSEADR